VGSAGALSKIVSGDVPASPARRRANTYPAAGLRCDDSPLESTGRLS
jgi:hypothetical protein